jgi:hypothetical protein
MRTRTWKIIDYGDVPKDAKTFPFEGDCGHEAMLPCVGTPIAQMSGGGVVFDNDMAGVLPDEIQCRKCGRVYELASRRD